MKRRWRWLRLAAGPLLGIGSDLLTRLATPYPLAPYYRTFGWGWLALDEAVSIVVATLLLEAGLGLDRLLEHFMPWQRYAVRRVAVQVPAQAALGLAAVPSVGALLAPLYPVLPGMPAPTRQALVVGTLISALVVISIALARSIDHFRKAQLAAEEARRAALQAELGALRAQLDPHFLFNVLNTLAALIPEAPARAVEFVERLSLVYRDLLRTHDRDLVALGEELDFIDAYLWLCAARFEGGLRAAFAIPADLRDRRLPPLALQLLVENALKHNVVAGAQPLRIEICAAGDRLEVRNNLQPKPSYGANGVGLENLVRRYRLLGAPEPEVLSGDGAFVVRLALVPAAGPARASG